MVYVQKPAQPERVAQCARSIRSFKTRAVAPPRQAGEAARDQKTASTEAAGCTINPTDDGKWSFWYSLEGEGNPWISGRPNPGTGPKRPSANSGGAAPERLCSPGSLAGSGPLIDNNLVNVSWNDTTTNSFTRSMLPFFAARHQIPNSFSFLQILQKLPLTTSSPQPTVLQIAGKPILFICVYGT